jgi:hypothetical protein
MLVKQGSLSSRCLAMHCYELKKDKPWFDEGCSGLLGQREQSRLQWLQVPSEINGDNLINIRREATKSISRLKRGNI